MEYNIIMKDKNIKAEKHNDDARWTLAYFETVDQAKSWIGNSKSFRIIDSVSKEILEQVNPEALDRRSFSVQELVDTADSMVTIKKSFY